MKDQIDVPLVIDADGKVLLTVENSKKYLQQMAKEEPQVRKASKRRVPPAEENETGEEDELLEGQPESRLVPATTSQRYPSRRALSPTFSEQDQPESHLVPATTSQRHPSRRALSPTFSEQELMSRNVSGQRQPNVEPEHRPGHPAFLEDTNDNAPTSVSRPLRPVTQFTSQHQPTRPALSESTRYRGSPTSETQPRPTKRLRVAQGVHLNSRDQQPPAIPYSTRPTHPNAPNQQPTVPRSTRPSHPDALRKRKRTDLDENEQVECSGRPMRPVSRLQQPTHLHSGHPGPSRAHLQVSPPYQAPHPHFVNYHDNIYSHPHPYYANYNMHPYYAPPTAPPTDDHEYVDDENYAGLR